MSINSGMVVYYGSLLLNAYKKQDKWATLCLWYLPSLKHAHTRTHTCTCKLTGLHLSSSAERSRSIGRIMQRYSLSSRLLGNRKTSVDSPGRQPYIFSCTLPTMKRSVTQWNIRLSQTINWTNAFKVLLYPGSLWLVYIMFCQGKHESLIYSEPAALCNET